MKQLILFLFVLGSISLSMVSCDKNQNVDPKSNGDNSSNGVSSYCSQIDDWVATNYPGETIDSVLIVTTQGPQGGSVEAYEVYISNGAIAYFEVTTCNFLWQIPPPPPCGCPTNYDPVCWNGTTYDNQCLALCDGANPSQVFPGPCGACGCPTNYDPVCWNNMEYDNECLAICDGADPAGIVPGPCPSGGGCINTAVANLFPTATIVNIIEGYQAVMYGNAYYAVTLDFSGTQVLVHFDETCLYYSMCGCDPTVAIVCANGNENFINQCEAECAGHAAANITPGPC